MFSVKVNAPKPFYLVQSVSLSEMSRAVWRNFTYRLTPAQLLQVGRGETLTVNVNEKVSENATITIHKEG